MYTIFRNSHSSFNYIHNYFDILVGHPNFRMSIVGYMAIKKIGEMNNERKTKSKKTEKENKHSGVR